MTMSKTALQRRRRAARDLIATGVSVEIASQRVGLPIADVESYLERLSEGRSIEEAHRRASEEADREAKERQQAINAERKLEREIESERRRVQQQDARRFEEDSAAAAGMSVADYRRSKEKAAYERAIAAEERRVGARQSLLATARAARMLGLSVRSSKSKDGQISSYYIQDSKGSGLRVSDHEIPATRKREAEAEFRGESGYSGYAGDQFIIDRPIRDAVIKRGLQLYFGLAKGKGKATPATATAPKFRAIEAEEISPPRRMSIVQSEPTTRQAANKPVKSDRSAQTKSNGGGAGRALQHRRATRARRSPQVKAHGQGGTSGLASKWKGNRRVTGP